MHDIALIAFYLTYTLDVLALMYFSLHTYMMIYLYAKNPTKCRSEYDEKNGIVPKLKSYPMVTIQLPVYNEYYVVERLIDSVLKIKYPQNKLEIQVLDDSTDECRDLVAKKVKQYQKKGFNIQHIHRINRIGHKAGALKEGLKKAKGKYIAIFDADFIPSVDFLEKTIPYFSLDKKIGMVQSRWGHINKDYSILTKAQSIGVDGHFIIEQVARNASDLWMNFNGTAGIWLKECIIDAGNWESDTLTEDFDLSYRAELKGWKFKYLRDVVCPAELPATITAFKSQQFRWCKGSLQTAVKLIPTILKSNLSLKIKFEAITHLTMYTVHPLMYLNILITPCVILLNLNVSEMPWFIKASLLLITMGPMFFYTLSQKYLYTDWKVRILWLPFLTLIGSGIAVNNTKAWLEGVFGKQSSFVRTPKMGMTSKNTKNTIDNNKYFTFKLDIVTIIEFITTFYILGTIYMAVKSTNWFIVPFLVMYFLGFAYINFLSLYDSMRWFFIFKKKNI